MNSCVESFNRKARGGRIDIFLHYKSVRCDRTTNIDEKLFTGQRARGRLTVIIGQNALTGACLEYHRYPHFAEP